MQLRLAKGSSSESMVLLLMLEDQCAMGLRLRPLERAWGKEAVEVMKLLESMMLEQRGAGVTRLRMIQTISIAVQAWNAEVCKAGIVNTLEAARSSRRDVQEPLIDN